MSLADWAIFDECYKRLRASGWPKERAAMAARRYLAWVKK